MKSKTNISIALFILLAMILTACNIPAAGTPTQDPSLILTQAVQTSEAIPTNPVPTNEPTFVVTEVPSTPIPVNTATTPPTAEPTATSTTPPTQATPTESACTNLAEFASDVTVPDDTEMLPGQEFIKTWRLQNAGTCTWTNQYALVYVSGDQMSGTSPLPLTGSTPPGSTADISVTLKAPGTVDTYRGDWELRSARGVNFSLESNSDQIFYVQIKVVEGVSELNLGASTWSDNLDNVDNWYLLDTPNTKFTEGDGVLVMKSIQPGAGEEWGISDQPSMKDYYLQTTFITGGTCSGRDKYGLLARAPEPDQGYVFEFSCDGSYRLYTWDGENYNALQEWRAAASILAGANQTNVMGFWMQGNSLRLYANGHKIAEFTDSMFDEGQFGLVIGSVNTDNFTVSVDKIEYWKFDQ